MTPGFILADEIIYINKLTISVGNCFWVDSGLVRLAPSKTRIHSRFTFLYKLSLLFQLDFFPESRSLLTERTDPQGKRTGPEGARVYLVEVEGEQSSVWA